MTEVAESFPAARGAVIRTAAPSVVSDYVTLTKPRTMSLLFVAVAANAAIH
jgi:heme O synthase-like polyprenyltransferase